MRVYKPVASIKCAVQYFVYEPSSNKPSPRKGTLAVPETQLTTSAPEPRGTPRKQLRADAIRATVRMVAVDMDGTFLTDAKTFDTARFDSILRRMDGHGIRCVVASGNTYAKLAEYMRGFENRGIIYVAENGAYLRDDAGDIAVHPFAPADIPRVYTALDALPHIGAVICTAEGTFLPVEREPAIAGIIEDYFANRDRQIPHGLTPSTFAEFFYPGTERVATYEQVRGNPIKISLQTLGKDTYRVLERLRRTLPEGVTPMASGFGAIDLVRTGANKGAGLADLCDRLGIDPVLVVAFGDGDNDREMLSFAGVGVAVGEATEDLLQVADEVIGSHNDGAVLTYMEAMLDELDALIDTL